MGIPVIIYGRSGTGKSRSIKNFEPEEVAIINVEGKQFPFRKVFPYVSVADDINEITSLITQAPCRSVVIDDAGYIMTHRFMRQHKDRAGGKSFDMYNDIADDMYTLIRNIKTLTAPDMIVYVIFHEDLDDGGRVILKTLGKLLNDKVTLEGMVTVTLHSMCANGKYYFKTQNNGMDITKSPEGMFESAEIANDLKMVDTKIREYWNL